MVALERGSRKGGPYDRSFWVGGNPFVVLPIRAAGRGNRPRSDSALRGKGSHLYQVRKGGRARKQSKRSSNKSEGNAAELWREWELAKQGPDAQTKSRKKRWRRDQKKEGAGRRGNNLRKSSCLSVRKIGRDVLFFGDKLRGAQHTPQREQHKRRESAGIDATRIISPQEI